jgi:hypothetical protein
LTARSAACQADAVAGPRTAGPLPAFVRDEYGDVVVEFRKSFVERSEPDRDVCELAGRGRHR